MCVLSQFWRPETDFGRAMLPPKALEQGSPTSRIQCLMIWGGTDVIIIGIKCTINLMHLNHPQPLTPLLPSPWKNCLPQSQNLMSKSLGTAALGEDLSAVEEDIFLCQVLLTGLRIKLTWDRLTRESKQKFNNIPMGETPENWVTH